MLKGKEGRAHPAPNSTLLTIVNDYDDYDQHVRELAFDKRSKPKDRTKTEEEKAERRRREGVKDVGPK